MQTNAGIQNANAIYDTTKNYAAWDIILLRYQTNRAGYRIPLTVHQNINMDGSFDGFENACKKVSQTDMFNFSGKLHSPKNPVEPTNSAPPSSPGDQCHP